MMDTVAHVVVRKRGHRGLSGGTQKGNGQALAKLQALLEQGRAKARLDQTQLARRAGLGRTTVSQALRAIDQVPSVTTVAAMAKALGLDADRLLGLQMQADAEAQGLTRTASDGAEEGIGHPICACDPYDLEVHPAGAEGDAASTAASTALPRTARVPVLPGYVRRGHDEVLEQVVQAASAGRSGMLVLVGSSSTGKTRACWEAIQPLADQGWRLWHPFDPTRAEATLADIRRVGPRTVLWLNEAQHYLGDAQKGPDIAAAVRSLLTNPGVRPVLVLGTLWPEYDRAYTTLPFPGEPDRYAQVRALLAGRTVPVPDAFDDAAQSAARDLAAAGDRILAAALERAEAGRVTQDLAGAPELLHRFRTASPPARAILNTAMDARRLGVGLHLPLAFLTDAAVDYLTDREYDALSPDWAEKALAELAAPVHGRLAPLQRARRRPSRRAPGAPRDQDTTHGVVYRLADYLEQHGLAERRCLCPPASFWEAAHHHLTDVQDLGRLAHAAETRHRLQWAYHLYKRVDPWFALKRQVVFRLRAGDRGGAAELLSEAAAEGSRAALFELVDLRLGSGDMRGAEELLAQPAASGDPRALRELAVLRERAGDVKAAVQLLTAAADAGDTSALVDLARLRRAAGDDEDAERLLSQAADSGDAIAQAMLHSEGVRRGRQELRGRRPRRAEVSVEAGAEPLPRQPGARDDQAADQPLAQAAEAGQPWAAVELARRRQQAGDLQGAEQFLKNAAAAGHQWAVIQLARLRHAAGDREGAEQLLTEGADKGEPTAFFEIARIRRAAGDLPGAEQALNRADETGHPQALIELFLLLTATGEDARAEDTVKRALNAGKAWGGTGRDVFRMWSYGLDPDGTPTPPW
ncbi:helix-turn-helix domain-containing protein [Streptomyces sp. NPDC001604]|uniref:helix-turn-helix domain-containing protein n=2 Tax=unclassified Streptomyces TaxID=2593676 RepID=UPI0036C8D691